MAALHALPIELIDHIVAYLPTAQAVSNLSQTSRTLHAFIEKEGWRSFFHSRFSAYQVPPDWKNASRALTTLSRNWDRRAFLAQYLEPGGDVKTIPGHGPMKPWRRPRGQTMGFQPAIDSYEHFIGNGWDDRREVLAWSAGAELLVRTKSNAKDAKDQTLQWWSYKPPASMEGLDDITSIKIFKPRTLLNDDEREDPQSERILVGTARCSLQLLRVPGTSFDSPVMSTFDTMGRPVRSTSIWQYSDKPLLAANLSDSALALYPLDQAGAQVSCIGEINAIPQSRRGCRIWSSKFLNHEHLAVGLGPSVEPVHVFGITPDGITKEPLRKFSLVGELNDGRLDSIGSVKPTSSIYPIEPLQSASTGSADAGNTFLSGGYDGIIRLHDMRSPSPVESTYTDPTDDAAIYSLLARDLDRFLAGTSRHSLLKVFDLRMPHASDYSYVGAMAQSVQASSTLSSAANGSVDDPCASHGDWNVFLNPRDRYSNSSGWRGPDSWMRRSAESSIYSLSSPSPFSPTVYAGVENAVVEFDFSSVLDKRSYTGPHPDTPNGRPSEHNMPKGPKREQEQLRNGRGGRGGRGGRNARHNPGRDMPAARAQRSDDVDDILNFAMYTQGTSSKTGMKLRVQQAPAETMARYPHGKQRAIGLDERWIETSER